MQLPDHIEIDEEAEECPWCGLAYKDFRSGHTFADVKAMLWVNSDDPKDWVYRRRNTVLGKWRQLKLEAWREHQIFCAGMAALEEEGEG